MFALCARVIYFRQNCHLNFSHLNGVISVLSLYSKHKKKTRLLSISKWVYVVAFQLQLAFTCAVISLLTWAFLSTDALLHSWGVNVLYCTYRRCEWHLYELVFFCLLSFSLFSTSSVIVVLGSLHFLPSGVSVQKNSFYFECSYCWP